MHFRKILFVQFSGIEALVAEKKEAFENHFGEKICSPDFQERILNAHKINITSLKFRSLWARNLCGALLQ